MPFYCPKCGTQNSDWAQTCLQCSAPLPYRPPGAAGGTGYTPATPPYGQSQAPVYGAPPSSAYQQQLPMHAGTPVGAYYPGHGRRFGASVIDGLLSALATMPGVVILTLSIFLSSAMRSESEAATASMFLSAMLLIYGGIFLMFLWNVYLLGRDGSSLGKRWMGIKVLDPNGQPLGFWKALVREVVKVALGNLCFILLLWPLWDNEKQGLYDKIFSTHLFRS